MLRASITSANQNTIFKNSARLNKNSSTEEVVTSLNGFEFQKVLREINKKKLERQDNFHHFR